MESPASFPATVSTRKVVREAGSSDVTFTRTRVLLVLCCAVLCYLCYVCCRPYARLDFTVDSILSPLSPDPSFDFNNDEPPVFHGTLEELRKRTDHHHRFEIRSGTDCTLLCNTGATNNHIMPLSVLQSKAAMEYEDV